MTPHNRLYLIAMGFAVFGWGATVSAEDAVTVVSTSSETTSATQKNVASDGSPVVHKSLHKKKQATTATASGTGAASTQTTPVASSTSAAMDNKSVQKQAASALVSTTHPQPTPTVTAPTAT